MSTIYAKKPPSKYAKSHTKKIVGLGLGARIGCQTEPGITKWVLNTENMYVLPTALIYLSSSGSISAEKVSIEFLRSGRWLHIGVWTGQDRATGHKASWALTLLAV